MWTLSVRRLAKRLAPLTPFAALAAACLLAAAGVSSCLHKRSPSPAGRFTPGEVPIVRVLLSPRAVPGAAISSTSGCVLKSNGRPDGHGEVHRLDGGARVEVTRSGGVWRIGNQLLSERVVTVSPLAGGYVRFGIVFYRGKLVLTPAGPDAFNVINHVDLESYLAGVLPKELYSYWSPQTYRALAVAARTFAMYHMTHSGKTKEYDLGGGQAWQMYGGFSAETEKSWDAVRYTRGIVLAHGPENKERIFLAQYSACCGGRVNPAAVLRNAPSIQPLAGGQVCEDCAGCRQYRWKPVRVAKADIYRAVAAAYRQARSLNGLKEIRIVSSTPQGRAVWLDLVAPNGRSIRLRADDLRLCLIWSSLPEARGLYSMNCRIRDLGGEIEFYDGRGFGHGVGLCQWGAQGKAQKGGLCQWGAQGKAQKGWSAEQILQFYYPGARLFRVY